MYLGLWSLVSGTVWEGYKLLGTAALLEEAFHRWLALAVHNLATLPVLHMGGNVISQLPAQATYCHSVPDSMDSSKHKQSVSSVNCFITATKSNYYIPALLLRKPTLPASSCPVAAQVML